ncbi:MAG: cupin domain-containing protein [Pseudomonadales bacterium]
MSDLLIGDLPPEDFLRQYWQQQPLLIRDGAATLDLPLEGDDLAGLSLSDKVESRLITCSEPTGSYQLQHGPFDEQTFATLPASNWTLLVQAVELWVPELSDLLTRIPFLPRWRCDDIMVSYAAPGGGVGPHFDQYDVFLVQAEGTRRWQIGQRCDEHTTLRPDSDLSLLAEFHAEQEWLLAPGDVLYLPPGVAHWGIAETAGITLSIGFRSPSLAELMDDLAVEIAARPHNRHLRDPALTPAMANDEIHPAYIAQVQALLSEMIADEKLLGDWLARYMTRPKYPDLTDDTAEQRRASFDGTRYLNGERET